MSSKTGIADSKTEEHAQSFKSLLFPGRPDDASEHKEDTPWLNYQSWRGLETRKTITFGLETTMSWIKWWEILIHGLPLILKTNVSSLYPQHSWELIYLLLLNQCDLTGEWRKNQTGEAILSFDAPHITKNEWSQWSPSTEDKIMCYAWAWSPLMPLTTHGYLFGDVDMKAQKVWVTCPCSHWKL